MIITPTQTYKLMDVVNTVYVSLYGSGVYGAGDQTFGASLEAISVENLTTGASDSSFSDADLQILLVKPASLLKTKCSINSLSAVALSDFLFSMSTACAQASVTSGTIGDLNTYLSWYNYVNNVTFWQCLAPPDFNEAYYATYSRYLTAKNVYFPVRQGESWRGTTFTNALRRLVIGTGQTAGYTIDRTKYAGGIPRISWTGLNGSGAVSVTVTGKDSDNATVIWTQSGTWGVAPFDTASGNLDLPNPTNKLITEVTDISSTGFSAGTIYAESGVPSGRVYPTT
jgi:hypothetical protein